LTLVSVRIGALRLADSAPVAVAAEWGLFEQLGIEAEISVEPSWANLVDKLAYGLLDAAVILPPLVLAANMGLRGTAARIVVPMGISQTGNAVVLANGIAPDAVAATTRAGCDVAATGRAFVAWLRAEATPPRFAVVHTMSTHNLLLRHWLAEAGGDPDRDIQTVILPPDRVVDALAADDIVGFCAGAPWGDVAEAASWGRILLATGDIRPRHPEKCFAVAAEWAAANGPVLTSLLRGLLRAGALCDDPAHGARVAALLAGGEWRLPEPETRRAMAGGDSAAPIVFRRRDAWLARPEDGLWFAAEMRRWGWIDSALDIAAAVEATYRPDLAASAWTSEAPGSLARSNGLD
jgi:NitT/TauT family transport system ATP-binding protein/nitrate/nitrite transport system substrate-binding protein